MESIDYLRFIAALGLVLGLAWLLLLAARTVLARQVGGFKSGTRRLQVEESLSLDAKHRLVLVRRDDTAHLLLLGPQQSLVVERGVALSSQEESAGEEV